MGGHTKAKKNRTNDKWYRLAKDQGYRARSAYKLLQINQRYQILDSARSVIDLAAAPGGWLQVTRKLAPQASIVLGFDLLPIKPIPGVKTFVCDITTPECRQIIKREVQTFGADVVLCDGAPNVGSAYAQDAFVQNSLALAALRLAADTLIEGGSFVTKAFRSADYNKLLWAIKQLFKTVNATKPVSSRQESAEIFIVAQGYLAPASIDPRLLSPDHVFKQVEGTDADAGFDIFHKKFNTKRNRSGYDESMGQTLRRVYTAAEFVEHNEPVKALSHASEISFDDEASTVYAEQAATNAELKRCMSDLRVLGKPDFKRILKWRLAMRQVRQEMLDAAAAAAAAAAGGEDAGAEDDDDAKEEEDPEAAMDAELARLRADILRKKKRERKKRREQRAKNRIRLAMSTNGAIELPGADDLFQLASVRTANSLEAMKSGEVAVGLSSDEEDGGAAGADESEDDEEDEQDYAELLERSLEADFEEYAERRNIFSRREKAKRSKRSRANVAAETIRDDSQLFDGDMSQYVKMLTHGVPKTSKRHERRAHRAAEDDGASGDEVERDAFDARDVDSSDDEEEVEEIGRPALDGEEAFAADASDDEGAANPLLVNLNGEEAPEVRSQRWFSNPLFDTVDSASAAQGGELSSDEDEDANDGGAAAASDDDDDDATKPGMSEADRVLAEMPMTDKQRRKLQREKREARKARKEARHANPEEEEFDVVASKEIQPRGSRRTAAEEEAHRKKIAAGFGVTGDEEAQAAADASSGFEVVPTGTRGAVPREPLGDERKYDSDNEEYDEEDRAETLALATMMLRKSKAKEMVDASYNRYAFNDDPDLPSWFTKDESNHLRPQIPIPHEIMEKMKAKFIALSNKPIKKVAEARARKRKRATARLNVAKSKAHSIAAATDISGREKMRAIEKTMRQAQEKKEERVYVVSRRSHGGKTPTPKGQKVKLVDPRLKNDMRAQKRREKHGNKPGKRRRR